MVDTIISIFSLLADLYSQTDSTTMAEGSPEEEKIDATKQTTDGKAFANEVFPEGSVVTPYKDIAFKEAYNTSQSYNRIMQLYGFNRADFYNIAVNDNQVRKTRAAYKKNRMADLASRTKEAVDSYTNNTKKITGSPIFIYGELA